MGKRWHFDELSMHDDGVKMWDWSGTENVGAKKGRSVGESGDDERRSASDR
jgi:hypothetical protein